MMVKDLPRENALPSIRKYLKDAVKSAKTNPAFVWNKLGHYKSEFRNHWMPHYDVNSGENDVNDAPLLRVLKHAWAFRRNRSIKTANRSSKHAHNEPQMQVTDADAPDTLLQDDQLFDEVPAFIHVAKDHPFFKKGSPPSVAAARAGVGHKAASSRL